MGLQEILHTSNNWYALGYPKIREKVLARFCPDQYGAKAKTVSLLTSLPMGVVAAVSFPISVVVGLVAMPIIALVKAVVSKDKEGAKRWLGAWAFTLLTAAIVTSYLLMATYMIDTWMLTVYTTGVAMVMISVTVFAYRSLSRPSECVDLQP